MAELNITQVEADILIRMEKHRQDDKIWKYPGIAEEITIPLISENQKEHFLLDIRRWRIDLKKGKYQTRGRKIIILVRLDFGGAPHRNPDGCEIASPHIHLYRENYGDKWAFPIPIDAFPNINDLGQTLNDFMVYCAITQPPYIEKGLWV
jgi:hypothetical protein